MLFFFSLLFFFMLLFSTFCLFHFLEFHLFTYIHLCFEVHVFVLVFLTLCVFGDWLFSFFVVVVLFSAFFRVVVLLSMFTYFEDIFTPMHNTPLLSRLLFFPFSFFLRLATPHNAVCVCVFFLSYLVNRSMYTSTR